MIEKTILIKLEMEREVEDLFNKTGTEELLELDNALTKLTGVKSVIRVLEFKENKKKNKCEHEATEILYHKHIKAVDSDTAKIGYYERCIKCFKIVDKGERTYKRKD